MRIIIMYIAIVAFEYYAMRICEGVFVQRIVIQEIVGAMGLRSR